jgi:sodium-dependent dicarboxylate transporter 2/3/5
MSRPEGLTLAVFAGVAIAWITRAPLQLPGVTLPGWSSLLPAPSMVDDGTVAIAAAVLLFLLPSGRKPGERLLDAAILPKLPWGIVLLFGGGFALADGFQASGLSLWVGENLKLFAGLPTWALIALVCLVITFLTEVTSNTASAQILLPLLAALAIELDIDPLLLMAPGAISCSCAFMLPVATPPNAIAFGTDRLRMADMVRAGIWLNLLGVALVTVSTLTIGRWALGM